MSYLSGCKFTASKIKKRILKVIVLSANKKAIPTVLRGWLLK